MRVKKPVSNALRIAKLILLKKPQKAKDIKGREPFRVGLQTFWWNEVVLLKKKSKMKHHNIGP